MNRIVPLVLVSVACVLALAGMPMAPIYAASPAQSYVVKAGDTLLAIALRFSLPVATLQTANNISDPDQLQVGQTLVIPAGDGTSLNRGGTSLTRASGQAHVSTSKYVVQAGDTLGAISLKYGVSLNELMRANNLNGISLLQIGQEIVVPDTAVATAPATTVELIPLTADAAQPTQSAQPGPVPTAIPLAVSPDADSTINLMRANILLLFNKVRAENNLPPLNYAGVLEQSAQGHANDCSARGLGSHIGSDGSLPSQRIAQAGYTGHITGENWAWAHTIEQAFDMWYYQEIPDQGPHLKNILHARYTEVGFGIAASNGGYYIIANFGAK